jgi:Zn-finger nucleic acid-binding protein
MKCPIDNVELVMTDRQGVEIDYCPKCRGVWLDRGELDKIIERADSQQSQPQREERREEHRPREEYRHDRDDERGYSDHHKKKRGGFLGDLFEFGD